MQGGSEHRMAAHLCPLASPLARLAAESYRMWMGIDPHLLLFTMLPVPPPPAAFRSASIGIAVRLRLRSGGRRAGRSGGLTGGRAVGLMAGGQAAVRAVGPAARRAYSRRCFGST